MALIELSGIEKTYPGAQPLHVLKGINAQIQEGEMVAIMGASGSGKSTLLNILGLLDTFDKGEYLLNGRSLRNLTESQAADVRSREIGFIFQSFNLIAYKDAVENIALPLFYQGVGRALRKEKALKLLRAVGLEEWGHHLPSELSGGQKQRIAIARALITEPKVILADEPTGALDSQTTLEVMELLKQVNQEGRTLIVVTHETSVAEMCDRTIHIRDGIIVG